MDLRPGSAESFATMKQAALSFESSFRLWNEAEATKTSNCPN